MGPNGVEPITSEKLLAFFTIQGIADLEQRLRYDALIASMDQEFRRWQRDGEKGEPGGDGNDENTTARD